MLDLSAVFPNQLEPMTRHFDLRNNLPKIGDECFTLDPFSQPLRETICKGCLCSDSVFSSMGGISRNDHWVWVNSFRLAVPRPVFEGTWFESDACALVARDYTATYNPNFVPISENQSVKWQQQGSRMLLTALGEGIKHVSAVLNRLYDIERTNIFIEFSLDAVLPRVALAGTPFDCDSSDGIVRTVVEPEVDTRTHGISWAELPKPSPRTRQ